MKVELIKNETGRNDLADELEQDELERGDIERDELEQDELESYERDRLWDEIAPVLRRAMGFEISSDRLIQELPDNSKHSYSSNRVAEMLRFVADEERSSASRIVQALSSHGLVSPEEVQEFEGSQQTAALSPDAQACVAGLKKAGLVSECRAQVLEAGGTCGDYLILEEIGLGGMGQVFKAMHTVMDRMVALKVLPQEAMRSPRNLRRFQREIRAIAKLDHSNIVRAFDAGESNGIHYLAMEFVDGRDLGRIVAEDSPFDVCAAIEYTIQAARAIDNAHQAGVIHRDVKPSNLLLSDKNEIKVSDLGLAMFRPSGVAADRQQDLTAAGSGLGTFSYMAPEQFDDASTVDVPADVYGLGCTLFYLLVGRSPVVGVTVEEKSAWHHTGKVPALTTYFPDLPVEVDVVFQRMVAKDPADRFPSMSDVADALEACLPEVAAMRSPGRRPADSPGSAPVAAGSTVRPAATQVRETPQAGTRPKGLAFSIRAAAVLLVVLVVGAFFLPTDDGDGSGSTTPDAAPADPPDAIGGGIGRIQPDKTFVNSIGMKLTQIPPGKFVMGAPATEPGTWVDEQPPHQVTITKESLYLGVHEVTQSQYDLIMHPDKPPAAEPAAADKPLFDPDDLPVVLISWLDAVQFCEKLSQRPEEMAAGRSYRLPWEGEWEYACRAGTQTVFAFGDTITVEQANFFDQTVKVRRLPAWQTHAVGSYDANPFGLFDMHGNVWEFCQDRFGRFREAADVDPVGPLEGRHRVIRGGAAGFHAKACRSASRQQVRPDESNAWTGFRVACEVAR